MRWSITSRQLEGFRAVMLTGSITQAAELLHLTQPAVSRIVRELEGVLDLKLFERHGNHIVATAEALLLYEEVSRSFVGLDRILQAAEEIRANRKGSLRITAMTAPALHYLPTIAAEYQRSHPDVFISVHADKSRNVLDLVGTRQFDIGLAYAPREYPGVETVPILGLSALCILPRTHRLAESEVVALTDLDGEAMIVLGAGSMLWTRAESYMKAAGVHWRERMESSVSEAIYHLVAEGVGIALIDPFTASSSSHPDIVIRPTEPSIPYDLALLHQSNVARSRIVEDFSARILKTVNMAYLSNTLTAQPRTTRPSQQAEELTDQL